MGWSELRKGDGDVMRTGMIVLMMMIVSNTRAADAEPSILLSLVVGIGLGVAMAQDFFEIKNA